MTFSPQNTIGPFISVNQTFSENERQRLIQMTNRDRDIARGINDREIAIYSSQEIPTGQQWDSTTNTQQKRSGFRKIVNLGGYAPGTVNIIPHGILGIITFTHIYGTGLTTTDPGSGLITVPLPYTNVTAANAQIDLKANATNVFLDLGAATFTLSSGIVVLEYLKN